MLCIDAEPNGKSDLMVINRAANVSCFVEKIISIIVAHFVWEKTKLYIL